MLEGDKERQCHETKWFLGTRMPERDLENSKRLENKMEALERQCGFHTPPEHPHHKPEIPSKAGTCCSLKDKQNGNIRDYKLSQTASGNPCNKNFHNQSWKK